jgi:hypothetical protein
VDSFWESGGAAMKQLRTGRISRAVVVVAVCTGSATLGFILGDSKTLTATAFKSASLIEPATVAQSDEKTVLLRSTSKDPLTFSDSLWLKTVGLLSGETFSARSVAEKAGSTNEGWLERLQCTVKNQADKRILYVRFEVSFPDTMANGQPIMVYRELTLGIPPRASGAKSKNGEPLSLDPGQTQTLVISSEHLKVMDEFLALRQYRLNDLTRVDIQVLDLFFDDGTKWSGGGYYKPNPNAQWGWERIDR